MPSCPFLFEWFLISRSPLDPAPVWIPSSVFERSLLFFKTLLSVLKRSIPTWFLNTWFLADVEADAVEGLKAGDAVLGELVVRVGVVRRPVRGEPPGHVVVGDVLVDRVE